MSHDAVLVTGASSGIGAAVVERLDRLGFRVLAGVRSDVDADALRASRSSRVTPVRLDVTDPVQIAAAAEIVGEQAGGRLAGLVNNAGVARGGPLEYLDLEELRDQLEINLIGQLAVTQAMLEHLRRATGRIVMVGSISGRVSAPNLGPYAASKHALAALTESLRAELAAWKIRVALVEPGSIQTAIWDKADDTAARVRAELPTEAIARYGGLLDHTEAVIAQSKKHAAPASKVADAVEHALTARRPKPTYVVGRDARAAAALLRVLPHRLRAALVRRI